VKDEKMDSESRQYNSQTERAYRTLKRSIMDNELVPAAIYLERELAEMMGMSRTPVREAARRLEAEGFVKIRPRHGITVLPISPEDMTEIYALLAELEPMAAELAARHGLSDVQLDRISKCVEDMDQALEEDNLDAWADADHDFHQLLVSYSGNKRLEWVVSTFWDQVYRARKVTLRIREKPVGSNRDHRNLVQAIKDRDPVKAREIHKKHREQAADTLVKLIAKHGLQIL
jgi:DNA-binding GntR family transcriptional regulator